MGSRHAAASGLPIVQAEWAGGRAAHDVGGLELGPINRHEYDLALWGIR
jgi:hypothetical protein